MLPRPSLQTSSPGSQEDGAGLFCAGRKPQGLIPEQWEGRRKLCKMGQQTLLSRAGVQDASECLPGDARCCPPLVGQDPRERAWGQQGQV